MIRAMLLATLTFAVACSAPPKPPKDAGPDEDAGTSDGGSIDGGADAGRVRGDEPPNGWSVALPFSADAGATTRVGVSATMALDQFGHPMIAAIIADPNGDGVFADNRVVFTRWNGVTKAWQAPLTVEVVGAIDLAHPNRQVSLARNPANGMIGIAYVNETGAVRFARSDDEGDHFSIENANAANGDSSKLSNPVIAFAAPDTLHLAYAARPVCGAGACGKILHRTRTGNVGNSPGAFTDAPEVQGSLFARDWPFAMALDSAGNPGFAFFSDDTANVVTLSYVAAGSTQTIATSDVLVDAAAKTPSVSLTLAGDVPRVAFHLLSSTSVDAQLWYAAKASGSWSSPFAIPRNGPAGMLDSTQWYQGIVSEGGTKVAVVANFQRAGAINQLCGGPKLARSTDGVSFGMPCHPTESGGPTVHAITQGGLWISMASHRTGKLTIALDYEQTLNPAIGGGVIVYREP